MRRLFVYAAALMILAATAVGQETSFGKNKVRYKSFDWSYVQTRHFDVYFYENAYETAKFATQVLESAYVQVTEQLDWRIQRRIPVFIYNSPSDFQQTNIISSIIPEAVGGFTEAFKNRVVVPNDGSYENLRHVLHHELTHAVVYDLLYGGMLGSLLSQGRLFDLPAWFAEGFAEYSSRFGWDYFSDMYVRDATINNYLAPIEYLDGYIAYREGQAMINYIVDKYGVEKLGELLQKGKIHLTMAKALKASLNISEKDFWEGFSKEMKRRYWPEIAKRKEPGDIGTELTKSQKDGSYYNEKPVYSPEGDKIAIFTDIHDYTEIVLISAVDGRKLERLVKGERSGDMESLHSYVSGMTFSPDGKNIAFVTKSKGKDALFLYNLPRRSIYKKKRFDFYSIVSPAWSPDGKSIAFSALGGINRDLYIWDIQGDTVRRITNDAYDDGSPSWMPNSNKMVFMSDRPHPDKPAFDGVGHPYPDSTEHLPSGFEYGNYNLFQMDLATSDVTPLRVGPGANKSPVVSPDGKRVAFISNRNGIDNIYISYFDTSRVYAVTDILTGVQSVSWSPDGQKLAFQAFHNGGFDVYVLKELVPVGDNGVLSPTDFAAGKYVPASRKPLPVAAKPSVAPDTSAFPPRDTALAAHTADTGTVAVRDTMLAMADTTTRIPDTTALTAPKKDTTEASTATKTGIYGDDYVFVSDRKHDALDSLMTDMSDTTEGGRHEMKEPASFDSIPPQLPGGEFEIKKYKVKFTPDYVGGGFSYNTFFGLQGQSYFIFSDYLGNHQFYVATDLVNTIDQSNIQAYYLNSVNRTNYGVGVFHSKNYYTDNNDYLFSDRFYGFEGFLSRPITMFKRVDLIASQYFIDRQHYDIDDTVSNRSSKVTLVTAQYVLDNVLWGYTGPINGRRAKLSLSEGADIFNTNNIEFHSVDFDYRKYWHIRGLFSAAFRLAAGASFGTTPKQYFLGGTTNWIGSRTLDAKVYNVENLYFSEIVTPMRGVPYYGLSGDRFGLMNFEFRFPLVRVFAMGFPLPIVITNVTGTIFTDIGATWTGSHFKGVETLPDGSQHTRDIHTGFGCGMRMNLFGLALLRYDLAWTTDYNKISDRPSYYFSLGADF